MEGCHKPVTQHGNFWYNWTIGLGPKETQKPNPCARSQDPCNISKLCLFVFILSNWRLSFPSKETLAVLSSSFDSTSPQPVVHHLGFSLQCHQMSSQTSWSPPRLWLKCNRLLTLGRPVDAVTLCRWEWWWNERWIWGARGALNLISTNYPDHGHHGRLPLSRKNAHGRAGNWTRDLMVSSQELWPSSHEAGHTETSRLGRNRSIKA